MNTKLKKAMGIIIVFFALAIVVVNAVTASEVDSYIMPLILFGLATVILGNKTKEVNPVNQEWFKGRQVVLKSILILTFISGVITSFVVLF